MSEEEKRRQRRREMEERRAKRAKDYTVVRMKQSTLIRLKNFKTASDSINNIIEDLMNYYEANNHFIHTDIRRFEEDMLSHRRFEHFFPHTSGPKYEDLTIYRLYTFIMDSLDDVSFVKNEYANDGIAGAPSYVIVFFTEKSNIRRPFLLIKTSVDKILGFLPQRAGDKISLAEEEFVNWMPLFEAFETDFKLQEMVTDYYSRRGEPPVLNHDIELFINDKITESYEKSRGN
ncbi:MAG: hypothetical protein PHR06_12030 [Candidatus Cloacimonetes bacterium]|nr:hypothetical protein [Candidatus Cloacimonadota bacterium]